MTDCFKGFAEALERVPDEIYDIPKFAEHVRHTLGLGQVLMSTVNSYQLQVDYSTRDRHPLTKLEAIALAEKISVRVDGIIDLNAPLKSRMAESREFNPTTVQLQIDFMADHIAHHASTLRLMIALEEVLKSVPLNRRQEAREKAYAEASRVFPQNLCEAQATKEANAK